MASGEVKPQSARMPWTFPGSSSSEAISTGVLDPGDTMIQLGSTVYMYCCTDRPLKNEKVHSGGFLIPGRYSLSAGTNNCGTATKWYRDNFFEDLKAEEAKGGENAYSAMMRGLEKIAPLRKIVMGASDVYSSCEAALKEPVIKRKNIHAPLEHGLCVEM